MVLFYPLQTWFQSATSTFPEVVFQGLLAVDDVESYSIDAVASFLFSFC